MVSIQFWWQMQESIGRMMTSPRSFPSYSKGILQDVFLQRASSAWQGAQPQKLTVSMLLAGTSTASEWRDLLESRRQFYSASGWPLRQRDPAGREDVHYIDGSKPLTETCQETVFLLRFTRLLFFPSWNDCPLFCRSLSPTH